MYFLVSGWGGTRVCLWMVWFKGFFISFFPRSFWLIVMELAWVSYTFRPFPNFFRFMKMMYPFDASCVPLVDYNTSISSCKQLTRQSVPVLVRSHIVPVFSICMVLYCSKMTGWEKGSAALQSRILHFAEISEDERDMLIKKHMVSISLLQICLSWHFSLCWIYQCHAFSSHQWIGIAIEHIAGQSKKIKI